MVDDTEKQDARREEWVVDIAEGMSAVALIGALIVTLKDKGILGDDDIRKIKATADQFFADDLKSSGADDL
jgi:hypothetical protein